jgi:uncharacterized metal-binding protein YceD (DUF177 family)
MSILSFYNIAFKGLSVGKHLFEFEVDRKFFEAFKEGLVEEGTVKVNLTLDKQSSMMVLWFDVKGTVRVQCDRCLESYNQPIESKERMIVKLGDKKFTDGDDVIWVSNNDYQLNVAQLIYEYICLAIPIKKVHPDNENEESKCDPEMLEKLNKYMIGENEVINPAWNNLKKLLDNE